LSVEADHDSDTDDDVVPVTATFDGALGAVVSAAELVVVETPGDGAVDPDAATLGLVSSGDGSGSKGPLVSTRAA
jgi:hypothetical protein